MASQRGAKTLLQTYPQLRKGIELARRDILGHIPHTPTKPGERPARTGYNKFSVKQLQGVYLNQYYHDPIEKYAKMVSMDEWGKTPLFYVTIHPVEMPTGPSLFYTPLILHFQQVDPGFMFEQEERRKVKLAQLRRRGKGPPKKGSGKRKKK